MPFLLRWRGGHKKEHGETTLDMLTANTRVVGIAFRMFRLGELGALGELG